MLAAGAVHSTPGLVVPSSLHSAGWNAGAKCVEPEEAAWDRAKRIVAELRARTPAMIHKAKRSCSVIIVTHAEILERVAQVLCCGSTTAAGARVSFHFDNGSVSTVDLDEAGLAVEGRGLNQDIGARR